MRADIIRQLIEAHAGGNDAGFRKAALQLAAAESAAGHTRIAEDLRRQVATLPSGRSRGSVVDIAQPRGDLAEILEGGHRDERLRDIVLSEGAKSELTRVIKENRSRASLERHGIQPRRKLLFHGVPGCGKTLAAAVLAGEMGLPLLTVRLASLFSRFLGATANHVRSIFSEMGQRPAVYLFDEFDSIAQARGQSNDVGELRRVATAFLQLMDTDESPSLIVAATNHPELLDRAVFRRFDAVVPFEAPREAQLTQLVQLRLKVQGIDPQVARAAARLGLGLSYADAARACDDAIRSMVLDHRERLTEDDLIRAFEAARRRGDEQSEFHGRP
ncbi:MAG: ATP-binding protein [Deltaproteobacteria bacterium]|nr:ATP-binding protein [Deltaproteobacteria bacterium]